MTRYRQRMHKLDGKHIQGVQNEHQQHGQSQQGAGDKDMANNNNSSGGGCFSANDYHQFQCGDYFTPNCAGCGVADETENSIIFMPPNIPGFLLRQLVLSRLFLLVFQCAINWAMRDFATDAFKGINAENQELSPVDRLVQGTFIGLSCWDARHLLHIAQFGYLWESTLAFFPLFPALLRILGAIVQHLLAHSVNLFSAMLLSGIFLNNFLFVLNGLLLFRLVLVLTGGQLKQAILAVYVHCWSPCSIFYSALYTESLFVAFTQFALLHLYTTRPSRHSLLVTATIFSLAQLTRANGLTNAGFIGFQLLLDTILVRVGALGQQMDFRECSLELAKRFVRNSVFLLLCFSIMSLPLHVFEFMVHEKFCSMAGGRYLDTAVANYLHNGTADREIVLPGELSKMPWCNESVSLSGLLLPAYYGHVQHKYWSVGLFAYWQWRKLPLFLAALPTLGFAFYGVLKHTFGLLATDLRPIPEVIADKRSLVPFAIQSAFLASCGLIFYNVEVSIRILFSASPFLYIVLARLISDQTPEIVRPEQLMQSQLIPFFRVYMRQGRAPFLMFCYLFGFFIFGTMLHVNWLPFV